MSRRREKRAGGRLLSLNLELVRQQLEEVLESAGTEVCNAASCHPLTAINNTLFIGTWRDAANEQLLRQHRITHVLNVARELISEDGLCQAGSSGLVEMKCIPLSDSLNEDLERHFDEAFGFIQTATLHGRVLVYCRRGISRSAAIVIAYMMASEGLSFKTAFENVYRKRPCISLNLAFIQRLEEFETHLRANCVGYDEKDSSQEDVCREGQSSVTKCVLSEP